MLALTTYVWLTSVESEFMPPIRGNSKAEAKQYPEHPKLESDFCYDEPTDL